MFLLVFRKSWGKRLPSLSHKGKTLSIDKQFDPAKAFHLHNKRRPPCSAYPLPLRIKSALNNLNSTIAKKHKAAAEVMHPRSF